MLVIFAATGIAVPFRCYLWVRVCFKWEVEVEGLSLSVGGLGRWIIF